MKLVHTTLSKVNQCFNMCLCSPGIQQEKAITAVAKYPTNVQEYKYSTKNNDRLLQIESKPITHVDTNKTNEQTYQYRGSFEDVDKR